MSFDRKITRADCLSAAGLLVEYKSLYERKFWLSRWVLQRRLRLLTVPVKVAKRVHDVYEAANPDAILTMLMHKIGRAADAQVAQPPS